MAKQRIDPVPQRVKADPIGRALVTVGCALDAPVVEADLLATSRMGEALVRLPERDRWVPADWWAEA